MQSPPETCNKIILATAVLHNIAVNLDVNLWDMDDEDHQLQGHMQPAPEQHMDGLNDRRLNRLGQEERFQLCENRFAHI